MEGTEVITWFCMGDADQRVVVCPGVHCWFSHPAVTILFSFILYLFWRGGPRSHSFQWFLFSLASDQTCWEWSQSHDFLSPLSQLALLRRRRYPKGNSSWPTPRDELSGHEACWQVRPTWLYQLYNTQDTLCRKVCGFVFLREVLKLKQKYEMHKFSFPRI